MPALSPKPARARKNRRLRTRGLTEPGLIGSRMKDPVAYFNTTLSGRNVGKSTHFGVGLTYIINFNGKPSLPKSETK